MSAVQRILTKKNKKIIFTKDLKIPLDFASVLMKKKKFKMCKNIKKCDPFKKNLQIHKI